MKSKKKRLKILITGTRGIPGIQGGIETHCEELYPRIVPRGCHVTITRRTPYVKDNVHTYKKVVLKDLYAPRSKGFEAIIHTIISTYYARCAGFECIHIHGIGPSLCVLFARLLGLKVVVTHHGSDYKRQKWGLVSRIILRAGEFLGVTFAHRVIAVSLAIRKRLQIMYGRTDIDYIPNGVVIHKKVKDDSFLKEWDLKKKEYILAVGRFVPEKGFHDLIAAYGKMKKTPMRLVIAGDADHETEYSRKLRLMGDQYGCVLPGFVPREILAQLYSHTRLFILPSYHEGLPIALLEALSFGADVLVSDISAHREFSLEPSSYFRPGDIPGLTKKIEDKLMIPCPLEQRDKLLTPYDWDIIAEKTYMVYRTLNS